MSKTSTKSSAHARAPDFLDFSTRIICRSVGPAGLPGQMDSTSPAHHFLVFNISQPPKANNPLNPTNQSPKRT